MLLHSTCAALRSSPQSTFCCFGTGAPGPAVQHPSQRDATLPAKPPLRSPLPQRPSSAAPVIHSGTAIQAPIPSFGLWSPCCLSGHGLPPHRAKQLRHVGSPQCRMPLLPRYQNAPVGPANQPRCTEAPVCRTLHPNAPRSVTLIRRKRLRSHALHNPLCATCGASVLPTATEYCPEKGIPRVLVRHGSSLLKCWCSWCQLRTHKQRPGS